MGALAASRLRTFAFSALAAFLLMLGDAAAAPASAFPRFGNDGRVLTAFPGQAAAAGIARDDAGSLVVAGTVTGPGGSDIGIARYLHSGRLDPSFGGGHPVTVDLGGDEHVTDVALDSLGRIVVVGYSGSAFNPAAGEALVARFLPGGRPDRSLLPAGALDPSFGDGGVARLGSGGAQAVAVDGEDRVFVAGGNALASFDDPWQVWRLTADGQPDPSFGGGDGIATGKVGVDANSAEALTLAPRGRILIAVCATGSEVANTFGVERLRSDGTPDPAFGDEGVVKVDFHDDAACPHAIALDRQRWIVVAGSGARDLLAARLRSDGSLDPNFAGDGTTRIDFPGSTARLGRIAVDANRRVFFAGQIERTTTNRNGDHPTRFALARLDPHGRPDPNFGPHGRVAIRMAPRRPDADATCLALRGGFVYAAGFVVQHKTITPPSRFGLLRYDGVAKRREG